MDQFVWGPPLWRLMEDVAWTADSARDRVSEDLGNKVLDFFHSLCLAMPCRYCRESYTDFFSKTPIGPALVNGELLKWVWQLHEMVNRKIGKPGLEYSKLRKRMAAWTQASDASAVWDLMFIVAYNATDQRMTAVQTWLRSIPFVIAAVPDTPCVDKLLMARILLEQTVKVGGHKDSREALLLWLYGMKLKYDEALGCTDTLSFDAVVAKYRVAST